MHIVYTDRHQLHLTDAILYEGRPFITDEVPARAEIILDAVQTAGLGPITAPADHGLDPILAVHSAEFVDFLRTAYDEHAAVIKKRAPVFAETIIARGGRRKPKSILGLPGYYAFGVGSPILEGTWEAAYWSAQCALTAADIVRAEGRTAYALCRPPGHHAAADLYGGYCYLNNAAIAAQYLKHPACTCGAGTGERSDAPAKPALSNAPSKHPEWSNTPSKHPERSNAQSKPALSNAEGDAAGAQTARIAILDIDYHHGNGTQEIFYSDPGVLFCSLHAHPDDDYPYYWGEAGERGEGAGEGFNRNWPLPQGTGDEAYLAALDEALAVIHDFGPHYLVVSAGLDIAQDDPVGGFSITPAGFNAIGQRIAALRRPTVIVQEGGYLLERLGEDAVAFLRAFE